MRESLTKKERVKKKKDVDRLFSKESFHVRCRGAKLKYIENNLNYNRVMFCLIRKYGNAVERNQTKRIMREIYRKNKEMIKPGYDLAFILFPGAYENNSRKRQFKTLIKRARLLSEIK